MLLSVWQSTLRPGLSKHPSGADPPRQEVSPFRLLRFLCGGSWRSVSIEHIAFG